MDVAVENTSALGRTMKIAIPAAEVDASVEQRLQNLAKTVRINGFRPGKVPLRVVRNRYQEQVEQEVAGELLQNRFFQALSEQQLRPAGTPKIEPQERRKGEDLVFTAAFDVYPQIDIADLSTVTVAKPVAAVADGDIDEMVESLRRQRTVWETADRAAQDGDKVTIDFSGTVDGEAFEGGSAENFETVLGSSGLLEAFEKGITGQQPGTSFSCEVPFPDDYAQDTLAGKTATFDITLHKVESAQLPAVDAEFARALGIADGDLDALRAMVRRNMERELESVVTRQVKDKVLEALLEAHQVDLPASLVDQEAHNLAHQRAGTDQDPHDHDLVDSARADAEKRVALGLILSEIVDKQELKADPAKVRGEIERLAEPFDDKDAVINWYYSQTERLGEIETMVLEAEVIDWALGQMSVTEEPKTFSQMMGRS